MVNQSGFDIRKILGWWYLVNIEVGAVSRWHSMVEAKKEFFALTETEWVDN